MKLSYCFKKMGILLLITGMLLNLVLPTTAYAEEKAKRVVRVGWHEPPYFLMDESGRMSGYSYEYQRKVAAYTGWEYEYVEGTWSDLMQMLKEGKIDLMSDVSYLPERERDMLYSSIPMGTESYYVFVSPDNQEITSENIASLNGKRIGVTKGSIQKTYFLEWADEHDISANVIETTSTDEESLDLLGSELDAFVTMDVYSSPDTAVPICKIGSSDFFFVVNKERADLLNELDAALNKIQDENMYYAQQLHDKYLNSTQANKYLSVSEREWLANHGTIRVGYQDNYLAFCAKDASSGELTGALKEYLEYASTTFENAELHFETVPFATASETLEALKSGQIDCMFPANLTDYDAEMNDLVISPPVMCSEMDAVVRASEQKAFLQKQNVVVAVNEGNINYELFLEEHYPKWSRAYFKDTPTGLEAVAAGKADCVIVSYYRYNNISKQCDKLHLTPFDTGVEMDYCFAVREGDTELYSIVATITDVVPESVTHTALTYYSTEDAKTSLPELIREYLLIIMTVISAILLIIIILLLRHIRDRRKVVESEQKVQNLNRRVFVDSLTSVRNKGAYTEFMQKLQERIDNCEPAEFAVGIFDCNNLKTINDTHGHDKGDIYLKAACQLICKVFDHSPVFRIGGDEFAVILQNDDLKNREDLMKIFEERRQAICVDADKEWEEVHIAVGIAVYDPQTDQSVEETACRADAAMYENKKAAKAQRV